MLERNNDDRSQRWLCTVACAGIALMLTLWSVLALPADLLTPTEAALHIARGIPTLMLWFLPLWCPDLAYGLGAPMGRWLRLVCGAVGMGVGAAVMAGLVFSRTSAGFLVALSLTYVVLGAWNLRLGFRARRLRA